jgi:hypothetical protein
MRSNVVCALGLTLLGVCGIVRAQVVDRILAVVDDRPVLLSEVRLAQSVTGVSRAQALEAAIDERLMFAQAVRLSQTATTPAEEEAAFQSLVERLEEGVSAAAANDRAALRAMARRQLTILKYVDFRFRPLVRIDPPARGSGPGSADTDGRAAVGAAERLDQRAAAEDLDARIEQWVAELRASARIRYTDTEP